MGTLKKQALEIFNKLRQNGTHVHQVSINDFEHMYIILKRLSAYKKVKVFAKYPVFSLVEQQEETTVKVEVEMSADKISKIADEAKVNQCTINDIINQKLA